MYVYVCMYVYIYICMCIWCPCCPTVRGLGPYTFVRPRYRGTRMFIIFEVMFMLYVFSARLPVAVGLCAAFHCFATYACTASTCL